MNPSKQTIIEASICQELIILIWAEYSENGIDNIERWDRTEQEAVIPFFNYLKSIVPALDNEDIESFKTLIDPSCIKHHREFLRAFRQEFGIRMTDINAEINRRFLGKYKTRS